MKRRYDPFAATKTGFELVQANPDTARWTMDASKRAADAFRQGNLGDAVGNLLISGVGFALLFWTLEQAGRR